MKKIIKCFDSTPYYISHSPFRQTGSTCIASAIPFVQSLPHQFKHRVTLHCMVQNNGQSGMSHILLLLALKVV